MRLLSGRKVDANRTALKVDSVCFGNRLFRALLIDKIDEAETTRSATALVIHNSNLFQLAILFKEAAQVGLAGLKGQSKDAQNAGRLGDRVAAGSGRFASGGRAGAGARPSPVHIYVGRVVLDGGGSVVLGHRLVRVHDGGWNECGREMMVAGVPFTAINGLMEDPALVGLLPDAHELFQIYDSLYFDRRLQPVTVLEWSDRMTRCAGICYLKGGQITIRLSRRLLQYRPFSDTINTLLHEMIHAYLFLTAPRATYIDRDGHGPAFTALAERINTHSGSSISIYHSFADEVRHCQQHVWRCTGKCQEWPPYFGWVRRAMNRAPQPADRWFAEHQQKCGGSFIKVQGPDVRNQSDTKDKKEDKKRRGDVLGGDGLECPVCSKAFNNKYKLEFHVERCLETTKEPTVYIIDE